VLLSKAFSRRNDCGAIIAVRVDQLRENCAASFQIVQELFDRAGMVAAPISKLSKQLTNVEVVLGLHDQVME
jgi:hypothetical protein